MSYLNKMHSKLIFAKADYVLNPNVNATNTSRDNITISASISESKVNSSVLSPVHKIKKCVVDFLSSFTCYKMLHRADFTDITVPYKI